MTQSHEAIGQFISTMFTLSTILATDPQWSLNLFFFCLLTLNKWIHFKHHVWHNGIPTSEWSMEKKNKTTPGFLSFNIYYRHDTVLTLTNSASTPEAFSRVFRLVSILVDASFLLCGQSSFLSAVNSVTMEVPLRLSETYPCSQLWDNHHVISSNSWS